jgi:hypothetical protein
MTERTGRLLDAYIAPRCSCWSAPRRPLRRRAQLRRRRDLLNGAQRTTPFYVGVYDVLDGNEQNPRHQPSSRPSAPPVQALRTGDVDLFLTDCTAGEGYVRANPDASSSWRSFGAPQTSASSSQRLRSRPAFNAAIAAMKEDGNIDALTRSVPRLHLRRVNRTLPGRPGVSAPPPIGFPLVAGRRRRHRPLPGLARHETRSTSRSSRSSPRHLDHPLRHRRRFTSAASSACASRSCRSRQACPPTNRPLHIEVIRASDPGPGCSTSAFVFAARHHRRRQRVSNPSAPSRSAQPRPPASSGAPSSH